MEITKKVFFLFLFLIMLVSGLQAQELFYRKNLANIDVEKLTSQDISRFRQRASDANMTEGEVMSYLLDKGLSRTEVARLLQRMSKESGTQRTPIDRSLSDALDKEIENRDPMLDRMYLKSDIPPDSLIFGSELFNNIKLDFAPNLQLATPVNYVLGPGDKLIITLFGDQESTEEQLIDPNGNIVLRYGGVIRLGGLTVDEAETKIKNHLVSKGYQAIESGKTKLNISLNEYRTIPITVIGAKNSGNYLLPSVASAFHALVMAGGPNQRGTYRNIEVIRKGRLVQRIDLYKFIVYGDRSADILLQENDVVNIPVYENMVRVKGEVKRPGFFELHEYENLDSLLVYTGGFSPIAYKENIYVEQIGNNEFLTRDLSKDEFASYYPSSGDVFIVGSIANRYYNRVVISGAVNRPGKYGWQEGMMLSTLVDRAGGFEESVLLSRGVIYRSQKDNSNNYLRFVPEELMQKHADVELKDGDSVVVGDRRMMFPHEYVHVVGEVINPDKFPFGPGMTALDAILLAGGMKSSAIHNTIEIARMVDNSDEMVISRLITAESDEDLEVRASEALLEARDIVIVKPRPDYREHQIVTLEGEVKSPGVYALLTRNERLSSLLKRAGGLTPLGDENGMLIVRKSTSTIMSKDFKDINLEDKDASAKLDSLLKLSTEKNIESRTDDYKRTIREDGLYSSSSTAPFKKDTKTETKRSTNKKKEETEQDDDKKTVFISINNVNSLMDKPGGKYDLHLQEDDRIVVLRRDNTVTVRGSVNNQVTVNYMGNQLKKYIQESGGTLKNAQKSRIFVVELNGRAKMTKSFLGIHSYPKVNPGSVVVVPAKPKRESRLADPGTMAAMASILASAIFMISTLR